ncbi:hypothetical protein, conserved [Angomonas deanei]|uniref:Uncharacterized protein n=1 Tax=Angomonas deanei TaxID=59799 RepID=A0A7G2CNE2_9TRYP|nr:hypothetical protein, conserved [Angomonas deanei]
MNREYQDGNSIYRNGALHTMNSNALVPSSSILFNKNGSIVQNINTSVARMASPTSDSGAVNSFPNLPPSLDAMDHPLRQDSPNHNSNGNPHKEVALSVSSHSQEEVEDPLRVSVAVVRDRQVFLFTAGTSVYSYAFAQQVVTELAGNVMAVPDSG